MISPEDIIAAYVAAGVPKDAPRIFADGFELAAPSWISGEFGSAFGQYLLDEDITADADQFNCVDFSVAAIHEAAVCWRKTANKDSKLALGLFDCIDLLHMIVTAPFLGVDGKLHPAFYEPQPNMGGSVMHAVNLTPEQIKSCSACFFF
jgi:hypothetical protein